MSNYLERDRKYLSPALGRAHEIVAVDGKGSYLTDENGDQYLDMTSGIAVNQVGHSHPEVVQAISEQAAKCIHTSCVVHYPKNIELAERLASLMPGDIDCTFFCNSGAEAVDGAIKFAKRLGRDKGKTNILVMRGAFHGRSLGATSMTSSKAAYRKFYEPLMGGIDFLDAPNVYKFNSSEAREAEIDRSISELKHKFQTNLSPESLAAIMLEPLMGEGGYIPLPKRFLEELRALCDKHDVLLIFDEVQCGFGRTGKWFCSEYSGVIPDILIMAKGLSGGMPLGGFASKHDLMQKMPPGSHGSTFGGNPVSCAAALKLLEIIERDNVMANVQARSKQVFDFFEKEYPGSNRQDPDFSHSDDEITRLPVKVRGLGLMLALEFQSAEIVNAIKNYAFANKVLLLSCGTYGNIIRLAPDLTVSEEDMAKGLEVINLGLREQVGALA